MILSLVIFNPNLAMSSYSQLSSKYCSQAVLHKTNILINSLSFGSRRCCVRLHLFIAHQKTQRNSFALEKPTTICSPMAYGSFSRLNIALRDDCGPTMGRPYSTWLIERPLLNGNPKQAPNECVESFSCRSQQLTMSNIEQVLEIASCALSTGLL